MTTSQRPLPTGTVTFILTDIERSSQAWETDHESMATAVALHYEILDDAISGHEGVRPLDMRAERAHVVDAAQLECHAAHTASIRRAGCVYVPATRPLPPALLPG